MMERERQQNDRTLVNGWPGPIVTPITLLICRPEASLAPSRKSSGKLMSMLQLPCGTF